MSLTLPAKVSTDAAAAPPKARPSSSTAMEKFPAFLAPSVSGTPSRVRAVACPLLAFAKAVATLPRSFCFATEMSTARLSRSWASAASLVAVTRVWNAGRRSVSRTPVAICNLSMALEISGSLKPWLTLSKAFLSRASCCSSAAADLTPSTANASAIVPAAAAVPRSAGPTKLESLLPKDCSPPVVLRDSESNLRRSA